MHVSRKQQGRVCDLQSATRRRESGRLLDRQSSVLSGPPKCDPLYECGPEVLSRSLPGRILQRLVYCSGGTRVATQILIADDDPTIRLLLRRLVEKQRDWQVCGEASNGVEAIEGVERFQPDVVVMDLAMPVMNGLQAAPEIVKAHPRLPMLLISVQEVSKQLAWEARNAGYRGAVTKSGADEVLKGIETLLRHDTFFYADDGSYGPAQD